MTIDIRKAKRQGGAGTPMPSMHKTIAPEGSGTISREPAESSKQTAAEMESVAETTTSISDPVEDVEVYKAELYEAGYKDEDFFQVLDTLRQKSQL